MGFVFIHPHLSGPQGIALSVVIYVIVVGLLGALDVSHSGTWQDLHTPSTLPHLDSSRKESPCLSVLNVFTTLFFNIHKHNGNEGLSGCSGNSFTVIAYQKCGLK